MGVHGGVIGGASEFTQPTVSTCDRFREPCAGRVVLFTSRQKLPVIIVHVRTGVNPAGDTGDTSPAKIGLRGTVLHYVPRKFSSVKGVFGVNATLNTFH